MTTHDSLSVWNKKTQFENYTVKVRNRFKGLGLIDRVPDELWMEVHDIVQKTGIKTIPMESVKWQNGCLRDLTNICEKKRNKKQRIKGKT